MLLQHPISSSTYNSLNLTTTETESLSASDLAILGNIIRRHGMEDRFGVHYLHRHFDLPTNHILASTTTESGLEIHVPVPRTTSHRYQGTHYMINSDGTFQPYEFHSQILDNGPHGISSPPVDAFLKDFSTAVLARSLQEKVALRRIDHNDSSLQRELTGEGWTSHFPCNMSTSRCLDLAAIPVGWRFEAGKEGVKTVGIWTPQGTNKDTGHNVTPTPSGSIEPLIDTAEELGVKMRAASMICCH